jgi:hypothetical protein
MNGVVVIDAHEEVGGFDGKAGPAVEQFDGESVCVLRVEGCAKGGDE